MKRYPKAPRDSLAGVCFEVGRGEVFGFLGPNGAGKTTTIGILTTRIRPTGGSARVGGVDVVADPVGPAGARGRPAAEQPRPVALGAPEPPLPRQLSRRAPGQRATGSPTSCSSSSASPTGRTTQPDDFSGGQIQRMMIARALMHSPVGALPRRTLHRPRPAARLFLWEKVAELRPGHHHRDHHPRHGRGAILCERVAIIDHGTLLVLDTPPPSSAACPTTGPSTARSSRGRAPSRPSSAPRSVHSRGSTRSSSSTIHPAAAGGSASHVRGEAAPFVAPVAHAVGGSGGRLTDVRLGEPNLEDVFIHLTGRALR